MARLIRVCFTNLTQRLRQSLRRCAYAFGLCLLTRLCILAASGMRFGVGTDSINDSLRFSDCRAASPLGIGAREQECEQCRSGKECGKKGIVANPKQGRDYHEPADLIS